MNRLLFAATLITISATAARASEDCWDYNGNTEAGLNFKSAELACKFAAEEAYDPSIFPGLESRMQNTFFATGKKNPGVYSCQARYSGHPSWEVVTTVWTRLAPQTYCTRPAIDGPYSNLPDGDGPLDGVAGERFDTADGNAIRAANKTRHDGRLVSDFYGQAATAVLQTMSNQAVESYKFLTEGKIAKYSKSGAEVGHAIPRFDQNGCPCGTNSRNNAVLISNGINSYLSNVAPTPEYVQFVNALKKYAP